MRFRLLYIFAAIACIFSAITADAQILVTDSVPLSEDSVKRDFSDQPYFGIYKDNYFIFGPSVNHTPNDKNSRGQRCHGEHTFISSIRRSASGTYSRTPCL